MSNAWRLHHGIRTACQTACPTGAITFGNVNNPESAVNKVRKEAGALAYKVLEEINVRPTVDYAAKIKNNQRGAIDQRLDSDQRLGQLAWSQPLSATVTATVTTRLFAEDRGNGTPLQRNTSREGFLSLILDGQPDAARHWSFTAYGQDQRFQSFFSAVDSRRATETPANDQFSVPSRAAGASVTHTWQHAAPE